MTGSSKAAGVSSGERREERASCMTVEGSERKGALCVEDWRGKGGGFQLVSEDIAKPTPTRVASFTLQQLASPPAKCAVEW